MLARDHLAITSEWWGVQFLSTLYFLLPVFFVIAVMVMVMYAAFWFTSYRWNQKFERWMQEELEFDPAKNTQSLSTQKSTLS